MFTKAVKICERAERLGISNGARIQHLIDVEYAIQIFGMDEDSWLAAEDKEFARDYIGICQSIDREKIESGHSLDPNCFGSFKPKFVFQKGERKETVDISKQSLFQQIMKRPFMLDVILSKTYATQGVASLMKDVRYKLFVQDSLDRFARKDWGDISEDDKKANDWAVENGERVLAAYEKENCKIRIIIEADRSITTVLFPDEYQKDKG